MRGFAIVGLGVALAAGLPAAPVQADSLEQRVDLLEAKLRNQNVADLVLQLQRLQREVQQLRGDVELQGHALEEMKQRQRDLYLDIDRRLSQQGGETSASLPVSDALSGPQEAPPVPPPPATAARQAVAPPVVPAGDPAREETEYQRAFELLKQQRYTESSVAFRAFLSRYPDGVYAGNAQYWLGEASYVTRDFATALNDFKTVVERYPQSVKVSDALLKIGYIHYEQQEWSEARKVLAELVERYPETTAASLAGKRLEKMTKEGH